MKKLLNLYKNHRLKKYKEFIDVEKIKGMNMYKIILLGLVSLMFIGCATNGLYNVSKTVYIKGKEVVIENYDSLDEDTKRKLKAIDELAEKYDETRGKIVEDKNIK